MNNFKNRSMARMLITLGATAASVVATSSIANAANLVVNGDFSNGNNGFQSEYTQGTIYSASSYVIGTDPNLHHWAANSFGDHTTGTGNMMIVNGSTIPDVTLWSQTIDVAPNTEYNLATWIASWTPRSPAKLEFTINSTLIGPVFMAPTTGLWEEFSATWNSGSNTSATIEIVNQNTAFSGNGFTLDDISFEGMAPATSIPEPSSVLGLLAFGAVSVTGLKRKKKHSENRS